MQSGINTGQEGFEILPFFVKNPTMIAKVCSVYATNIVMVSYNSNTIT